MRQTRHLQLLAAVAAAGFGFGAPSALADGDSHFSARLRSVNEVPAVISGAGGRFKAELDRGTNMIAWELSYERLEGTVTQAHIHIGQRHTNGGIAVFLCANPPLPSPAGTQLCPAPPARISGTINASHVGAGATAQGVSAGEFAALVKALKSDAAYANVHSSLFPGGEIRGQIRGDHHDRDRD